MAFLFIYFIILLFKKYNENTNNNIDKKKNNENNENNCKDGYKLINDKCISHYFKTKYSSNSNSQFTTLINFRSIYDILEMKIDNEYISTIIELTNDNLLCSCIHRKITIFKKIKKGNIIN